MNSFLNGCRKNNQTKESKFLEGINIVDTAYKSIYGLFTSLINEINIKLEKNNDDKITVPKIIVIGTESCGKSSLLENITKCELFPRDSKICTMSPIHVILSKNIESNYYIEYKNNNQLIHKNVGKKEEIYSLINTYFKSLNGTYSQDEIKISLSEPNLPNFEFYDLPGLVAYPEDKAKITQEIIDKYLIQDNIILCVEDATKPRLTASQTIAMIQNKKLENRTILVLTKIDKLTPNDIDECLIDRIDKKSDEIKDINFVDCYGIINRDHRNNISLIDNDKYFIKWSDDLKKYISIEYDKESLQICNKLGINNLIDNINNFYNIYIDKTWKPKILNDLKTELKNYNIKLQNLGIELNNDTKEEIINIIINNIICCYDYKNQSNNIFSNVSIYELYHSIVLINKNLTENLQQEYKFIISNFTICNINMINKTTIIKNKLYNLYRFDNLKNKITNYINDKMKELLLQENDKIYKYIYDFNINFICDNDLDYNSSENDTYKSDNDLDSNSSENDTYKKIEETYYTKMPQKYNKLIEHFIIYPIMDDKVIKEELFDNLNDSDFEENIETIEKRKLYNENIEYIKNKIKDINNLFSKK